MLEQRAHNDQHNQREAKLFLGFGFHMSATVFQPAASVFKTKRYLPVVSTPMASAFAQTVPSIKTRIPPSET